MTTRRAGAHAPWVLSLVMLLGSLGTAAAQNSAGEEWGLYLTPRNPHTEDACTRGELILRYHDETWLLVDARCAVAERLAQSDVGLREISRGGRAEGFLVLVGSDRQELAGLPAGSVVIPAGDLLLVKDTSALDEWRQGQGDRWTRLPPGPLPLPGPGPAIEGIGGPLREDLTPFLSLLAESSFVGFTQRLQDFQTRYTYSDSTPVVVSWIADRFRQFGYADVRIDSFVVQFSNLSMNVMAVKPGTTHPEQQIVVGGHFDSVVQVGHTLLWAPGADDNGSGTAAVMEMARILAPIPLEKSVVFVAFGAEEQGLVGSWDYAARAHARGDDIRLMLNMDMIANLADSYWDVGIYRNSVSQSYASLMANMALTYTSLEPTFFTASANSDHYPFMQYGYPAVMAHEGDFSPCWHKPCDTTTYSGFSGAYGLEVVRMMAATLLTVAVPEARTLVAEGGDAANEVDSRGGAPQLVVQPLPGSGPFVLSYRGLASAPRALEVFDARGRLVCQRPLAEVSASGGISVGVLTWDGCRADGEAVPPGAYFARLSGQGWEAVARVVVVR